MPIESEPEALVIELMANDPIVIAAELPVAKVAQVLTDYDIGSTARLTSTTTGMAASFRPSSAVCRRNSERPSSQDRASSPAR